ncbi:hypothetical protein ACSSVZ_003445, partial [Amorphus sp. MBR-141]
MKLLRSDPPTQKHVRRHPRRFGLSVVTSGPVLPSGACWIAHRRAVQLGQRWRVARSQMSVPPNLIPTPCNLPDAPSRRLIHSEPCRTVRSRRCLAPRAECAHAHRLRVGGLRPARGRALAGAVRTGLACVPRRPPAGGRSSARGAGRMGPGVCLRRRLLAPLIPAKAGIHRAVVWGDWREVRSGAGMQGTGLNGRAVSPPPRKTADSPWIPAFAGMSNRVGLGCDGLCCFGVADDGVEMG